MSEVCILVVEDEPDNRAIICSVVQDIAGYKAIAVGDGRQALAAVAESRPALVILDLMLPELNGFEVVQVLKGNAAYQDVPVLAVTALARPVERDRALRAGCSDYIEKPFNLDEMVAKINRLLQLSSTTSF